MNIEEEIALPNHLLDHDYFGPMVVQNNDEVIGLSNHLLDHVYFRSVVYENKPNKVEELLDIEEEELEYEKEEEEVVPEENPIYQVPETYRVIPDIH